MNRMHACPLVLLAAVGAVASLAPADIHPAFATTSLAEESISLTVGLNTWYTQGGSHFRFSLHPDEAMDPEQEPAMQTFTSFLQVGSKDGKQGGFIALEEINNFDMVDVQKVPKKDRYPFQISAEQKARGWSGSALQSAMTAILSRKVRQFTNKHGRSLTFSEVMNGFSNYGCKMFVVGGAVRDTLAGRPVHDVDCLFACSEDEMVEAEHANGFIVSGGDSGPAGPEDSPYGATSDGKTDFDGLASDLFIRQGSDFTINALLYDPTTNVVLDPTGYGVVDGRDMILRPAIAPNKWLVWALQYTAMGQKEMRYFKFRMRGYEPVDDCLVRFIVTILQTKVESGGAQTGAMLAFLEHELGSDVPVGVRKDFLVALRQVFATDWEFAKTVDERKCTEVANSRFWSHVAIAPFESFERSAYCVDGNSIDEISAWTNWCSISANVANAYNKVKGNAYKVKGAPAA